MWRREGGSDQPWEAFGAQSGEGEAEYSELRAHLSVHIAYSSPSHRSIELLNHIFVYSGSGPYYSMEKALEPDALKVAPGLGLSRDQDQLSGAWMREPRASE